MIEFVVVPADEEFSAIIENNSGKLSLRFVSGFSNLTSLRFIFLHTASIKRPKFQLFKE